jgi:hypothetical protein
VGSAHACRRRRLLPLRSRTDPRQRPRRRLPGDVIRRTRLALPRHEQAFADRIDAERSRKRLVDHDDERGPLPVAVSQRRAVQTRMCRSHRRPVIPRRLREVRAPSRYRGPRRLGDVDPGSRIRRWASPRSTRPVRGSSYASLWGSDCSAGLQIRERRGAWTSFLRECDLGVGVTRSVPPRCLEPW